MSLEALAPETRNFIDGKLVESSAGGRFENINPANGESIGTCADGTAGRYGDCDCGSPPRL